MVALTEELAKEYRALYATAEVKPSKVETMKWYINKIQKAQGRYLEVEVRTGVPWHVIAAIHMMESSGDFSTHLHNGDSLNARTVHVPAGRPKVGNPPFSWEESACDALGYDGANGIKDWTLERTLWFLEGYNGWGYRTGAGRDTVPPMRSPYIWSYTQHYISGRYVKDGEWVKTSVSDQAGVVAIFKGLEARGLIKPLGGDPAPKPDEPKPQSRWEDVTWFRLHSLAIDGKIETGCCAMISGDPTPFALHRGIDKFSLIKFLEAYPNASHVLVAAESVPWPGAKV
jgi:lysozyme family protein